MVALDMADCIVGVCVGACCGFNAGTRVEEVAIREAWFVVLAAKTTKTEAGGSEIGVGADRMFGWLVD